VDGAVAVAALRQTDSGPGAHVVVGAAIFLNRGRGCGYVAVGHADMLFFKGRGCERITTPADL
jgi:hypothetical protein